MNPLRRLAKRFPLTAMISPLITWALHFVLVYSVVGLHCARPWALGRMPAAMLLRMAAMLRRRRCCSAAAMRLLDGGAAARSCGLQHDRNFGGRSQMFAGGSVATEW